MTRDAYVAAQKERFAAMDSNQDGVVTKDELSARMAARMGGAPPPAMVDTMFGMIDADGDGKATAAEAEAAASARFTAMDADKDGTLSPRSAAPACRICTGNRPLARWRSTMPEIGISMSRACASFSLNGVTFTEAKPCLGSAARIETSASIAASRAAPAGPSADIG